MRRRAFKYRGGIAPRDRFVTYISPEPNSGCWLWTGTVSRLGYGMFSLNGAEFSVDVSAHRFAYEMHFDRIPHGMHVLHKCDVRSCVNPDRLFLGTHTQNVADMVNKRRHCFGETINTAKLSDRNIPEIRRLANCGKTKKEIAVQFDIHPSQIGRIVNKKAWDHIK